MSLITGLRAEEFPDKTAELARDRHYRFVALEAATQQPGVTMVQAVLRAPADRSHLLTLPLLTPA